MSISRMSSLYRTEVDSIGEVKVPKKCYYGAQTQRSLANFPVGHHRIPRQIVYALALIKKAAAHVHCDLGLMDAHKKSLICQVCDEIIQGKLDDHFPLTVWQTGSGTQTNMNVNEVISNRAIELDGGVMGSKCPIHPNDDVNKSQSSNDVFPAAMHIAAAKSTIHRLLPSLCAFQISLHKKVTEFSHIIKVGRTHLMDAAPITLGQEFSGYLSQITHGIEAIQNALPHLSELALGGTAVGTGLNTPDGYAVKVADLIALWSEHPFVSAPNKFEALAAHDAVLEMSGAIKRVACSLMKIANDIRWLGSGPRCGLTELNLPANEPGSSIMPGKVNPTQCESLLQVVSQIIGNDAAITFGATQGNFELNTYKPVMIYNLLESIELLADSITSFRTRCLDGITANEQHIKKLLDNSLMQATCLNTSIGYDQASKIVKKAYDEDISLKQSALELKLLEPEQFDEIVDPKKMI